MVKKKANKTSVTKVAFNTLREATRFQLEVQQEILTLMLRKADPYELARALGAHLPFYHRKLQERILDLFIEGGALRSEAAGFCSSSLYFMERISPDVLARVGEITKETMRGRSN